MIPSTKESTKLESAKAFNALAVYLTLGPDRSLPQLAEALGKQPGYLGQLKKWSSFYGWQEKCRVHDIEMAKTRLQKCEVEIEAMQTRHIQIALQGQRKALARIQELCDSQELPATAAVQLLKLSLDLERVARGAATEQIALTGADNGPLEMVIKTVWGRNSEARKAREEEDLDDPPGEDSDDR
jgi:hypothetical protein